jgi:TolB-like protein/thioredoxin-like negative regulator of GroEL
MDGLFKELKRRNVVRVGVAYIVVGWVVVQIAQLLFEAFGTPDWVIKTVIVLIGIGFPFVLLFAWAFEITPDGIKKTREVSVATSITASTGRKLNFVIIGALVVALGYFVWERQALKQTMPEQPVASIEANQNSTAPAADESSGSDAAPAAASTRRSIAVLPFVNMSSDEEQEWFADGLTEEILNSLAKAPDLLVSARTSSFAFKGSAQPIPEIAAALGVEHVLEGSVRRGGDRIRVTAQLIRAMDGFHLWSETFDRTMDDIIRIQEEIAVQIARALETAMDPEALEAMMAAGTTSVAAYDAYLTGVGRWEAAGSTADIYESLNAFEFFEQSVELDPEFAQAWFRLFFYWTVETDSNQLLFGLVDLPRDVKLKQRNEALDNAIRFQKDPVTKTYYESYRAWSNYDVRRALKLIRDYYNQRPNDVSAFGAMLLAMRELGLNEEIREIVQEVLDKNELTTEKANQSLQALRDVRYTDIMRRLANESVERFGDNDASLVYQAHRQLLWAGDIDGAARLLPRLRNSDLPEDNVQLAEIRQLCAEGKTTAALALFDSITQERPDDIGLEWLGAKIVGDDERANSLFAEFDEKGDFESIWPYLSYSHFDPSEYPNFMAAFAGQGLENRQVIELPYRCPR